MSKNHEDFDMKHKVKQLSTVLICRFDKLYSIIALSKLTIEEQFLCNFFVITYKTHDTMGISFEIMCLFI